MLGFLSISFIAGVLTVLAPCILPLLPVIIGGSMVGESSVRRTFIIVGSLGVSVFLFTLLLKVSASFVTIPALFWQLLSGCLLLFFGFVTLIPSLWDRIPIVRKLYQGSNKLLGSGYQKQGVWGDIVIGAALGPVFSSCSPTYFVILAAVLPAHFAVGLTYLLSYVAGLCLFLFIIAFLGQRAVAWLGIASDSHSWFKKVIGVLFIFVGLAVIFGIDKKIELRLPSGAFSEIGIEQKLLSSGEQPGASSATTSPSQTPTTTSPTNTPAQSTGVSPGRVFLSEAEKTLRYQQSPELVDPDGYINTDGQPVTIGQYKGKNVVLVDFWDYSCINCQRTFPYLKEWYEKYKDQGLIIVGVHTPEFAFEQLQSNVEDAAKRFGLTYPITLDNHYQTWRAFKNQFWPREYLVDIDGYIVHDHAGEGDYDVTEAAIQDALAERAARLGVGLTATSTVSIPPPDFSAIQSPETYFGSDRNEYLGNGLSGKNGSQTFTPPSVLYLNTLYLGGKWNITSEYAEADSDGKIFFKYSAHDVYMVATNVGTPVTLQILRDGKPVGSFGGSDVDTTTSRVIVDGDRLYTLIHDSTPGIHTIEIRVEKGTLDAYTLTFG